MKFSILTPTMNRPDRVVDAVASVLAQSHGDWEQIVLDFSDEPIFDLLPPDPRIRYVHGGERGGPARDFQRALQLAEGEVVHPLSDDDRLAPNALELVDERLEAGLWLYGRTETVHDDGSHVHFLGNPFSLATLREGYNLGGAVYWRRELTDRIGGFDPAYDHAADYELYLRFALDSEPVFVPEVLYLYTEHPNTDSNIHLSVQHEVCRRISDTYRAVPFGSPEVSLPSLALDSRTTAVLAHADELLADEPLLAAWLDAFDGADDVTLAIYAPDGDAAALEPELLAACEAAAGGGEVTADLLLLTASPRQEGALARRVAAVLSRREPRGYFVTVPHLEPAGVAGLKLPEPLAR